jgi:hypothetical protein
MGFDLGNLLPQYLGAPANANAAQAFDDFDRVAQTAPRETNGSRPSPGRRISIRCRRREGRLQK